MISREELLKLAALARLHLDETEVERFQSDIAEMLKYVETLGEVDTTGIASLSQIAGAGGILREDTIQPSLSVEDALRNAPERVDNYIKVPKVVDN
jgi:aspartyl-tRNA(Asn)/glutamyl-tRNA(Gln) amidotransferase subunit C